MRPVRAVWFATWLVSGVSSVSLQAQQYDDDCDYKRPVSLNVDMSATELLRAETGAGSLEVRGVAGLRQARVTGTACASSSSLLGEISVTMKRDGARVVVETDFPDMNNNGEARIDLVIEVPAGAHADIKDGSGSMEVSGVGDLDIDDGSGELKISDISGSVRIEDGSGSVEITGVRGDVHLTDGSGEVVIRDIGGSVDVADGSGSIDVRGVRGSFVVSTDGSGNVDWSNVTGRVDVPSRKRGRTD
jgi:hypothetical protein